MQPFWWAEPSQDFAHPYYFTLLFKEKNILIRWKDLAPDNLYNIDWQQLNLEEFPSFAAGHNVEKLAYTSYENDLILVFLTEKGDFGGGQVVRIDGNQFEPKWALEFPGPNIGQPILNNDDLYITSFGFIGKIDLNSGTFLWQHDGLYDSETEDFNYFKMPILDGEKAIFQGGNFFANCPERLVVNESTGEILERVETCRPS
jgi:outer membrane protein assembly factor BamB